MNLKELIMVESGPRTAMQVIGWWELRRILYNGILVVSCIASSVLSDLIAIRFSKMTVDFYVLVVFFIGANFVYTLGLILDLWRRPYYMESQENITSRFFVILSILTICLTLIPPLYGLLLPQVALGPVE